jgi:hypothetical protein
LTQGHGPEQLEQVRQGLEAVLVDEDVVTAHLGPDADEPRVARHSRLQRIPYCTGDTRRHAPGERATR